MTASCHHMSRLRAGQPLTAPAVSPATIRFWKMITAGTSGTVITTEAAEIVPSGISNF